MVESHIFNGNSISKGENTSIQLEFDEALELISDTLVSARELPKYTCRKKCQRKTVATAGRCDKPALRDQVVVVLIYVDMLVIGTSNG